MSGDKLVSAFKNKPLHPIMLAAYPVLALLAHNIQEIRFISGVRALSVSIVGAGIFLLLLKLLVKDWYKAALICSLGLVLFFSYGHLYDFLEQTPIWGVMLGRHRFLFPLWLVIFALNVVWILRSQRDLGGVNEALNVAGGILLIFPIFQLALFAVQVLPALSQDQKPAAEMSELHLPEGTKAPDVYYIILDTYTRGDIFDEIYDFDNTPFLNSLRGMGFHVASCSQSNYSQTRLSLGSSLNMNYLDDYLKGFSTHNEEMAHILPLIHHNTVRQTLEELGYATVSFETGHLPTQWEDTDYYFSPKAGMFSEAQNLGQLSEFEVMLLRTSAGLALMDASTGIPQQLFGEFSHSYWEIYRDRILYTMDRLESVPSIPGPKFVFAHILAPHPPYVFEPNGELVQEEKGKIIGYRDQVAYVNQRMIPLLKSIISNSEVPPIIIVQGDHGPGSFTHHDRMSILNAYYLPGSDPNLLYNSISPVNSFRVVFDSYFGGNYPLLEDTSYFTISREPYEFEVVPNNDDNCRNY